jgi:hypothetical protein
VNVYQKIIRRHFVCSIFIHLSSSITHHGIKWLFSDYVCEICSCLLGEMMKSYVTCISMMCLHVDRGGSELITELTIGWGCAMFMQIILFCKLPDTSLGQRWAHLLAHCDISNDKISSHYSIIHFNWGFSIHSHSFVSAGPMGSSLDCGLDSLDRCYEKCSRH